MNETKTIRGRNGNEVEVVTRSASKKRQARESQRPMFGGPESSSVGGSRRIWTTRWSTPRSTRS